MTPQGTTPQAVDKRTKLAQDRLEILELARRLGNVSAACRQAGLSRSRFYEIKKAFDERGMEGLAPERRVPRMPNQVSPEMEQLVLDMTARYPTYGYPRTSAKLRASGIPAAPSTVRAVWERHRITLCSQRLLWLEQRAGELDERHQRLLERQKMSPATL
jgi:hypothetical protein